MSRCLNTRGRCCRMLLPAAAGCPVPAEPFAPTALRPYRAVRCCGSTSWQTDGPGRSGHRQRGDGPGTAALSPALQAARVPVPEPCAEREPHGVGTGTRWGAWENVQCFAICLETEPGKAQLNLNKSKRKRKKKCLTAVHPRKHLVACHFKRFPESNRAFSPQVPPHLPAAPGVPSRAPPRAPGQHQPHGQPPGHPVLAVCVSARQGHSSHRCYWLKQKALEQRL